MRPKQWYKNLVIFIGIIFSLNFTDTGSLITAICAFVIFCGLSSGSYLINDVMDRKKDRHHPEKRKRPIASGRMGTNTAVILAMFLVSISMIGSYLINMEFLLLSITYFSMIFLYSIILKRLIFVDVLVISVGFVLRAVAGCVAISVVISPWLILCAFFLALFLALIKRRNEIEVLGKKGVEHRRILKDYGELDLEQFIAVVAGVLIISYSLYTFLSDNVYMMITIPVATYGLFRYLYLIKKRGFGGDPTKMFRDKGIVLSMLLWTALLLIILYDIPQNLMNYLGVI